MVALEPYQGVACSDATEGSTEQPIGMGSDFVVQTSLSQESVAAGTAVQAVCVVKNRDGLPVTMPTAIRTVPEGEALIVDHTITATKAGVLQVQCGISGSTIVDDTPATLVVFEGPAIRTVAEVSPDNILSGQTSTVTCRVEDQYGNAIPNLPTTLELTNTNVALVTGMTLTGQQVGSTQVICAQAQVPADSRVPATLSVSVGSASKLTMQITPDQEWYAPGDVVTIAAYVTDDWGNSVGSGAATITGPNTGVTKNSASSWTLNAEGAHLFTAADSSGPTRLKHFRNCVYLLSFLGGPDGHSKPHLPSYHCNRRPEYSSPGVYSYSIWIISHAPARRALTYTQLR